MSVCLHSIFECFEYYAKLVIFLATLVSVRSALVRPPQCVLNVYLVYIVHLCSISRLFPVYLI